VPCPPLQTHPLHPSSVPILPPDRPHTPRVLMTSVVVKVVRKSMSTTPVIVVRKSSVGVGVGADVVGNKDTATTTPSAFPPSSAAAADKVDVAAERGARVTSGTPTLPAVGRWGTVVGVAAEIVGKTSSGTSTPVHFCSTIALAAMGIRVDAEIAM
jgi:hypothetical protein